jgi:hypothetical protein
MAAAHTLPFPSALAAELSQPGCATVLKVLDVLLKLNLGVLILDEYMLPNFLLLFSKSAI